MMLIRGALKTQVWKAFLEIVPIKEKILKVDVDFFKLRGISKKQLLSALSVLRHVRKDIIPLLRYLRDQQGLTEFSFLVHDYKSKPHLDLTLYLSKSSNLKKILKQKKWRGVAVAKETTEIAGVDVSKFREGYSVEQAIGLIHVQSSWYVNLIDSFNALTSDIEVLKQIGQFLHFYANMAQLVVV